MTDGEFRIGTCGFGRTKQSDYFKQLNSLEVQHTFYQPPEPGTLEKWRDEAPDNFEFTIKAWQLITHETSSPTYRRLKRELTPKESTDAGFFKPTKIVKEAYATMLACAEILRSRTLLFQCPARFQPTPENVLNMKRFFAKADRKGLEFAWEPRGKLWTDDIVAELCEDLDLRHCVDPFARRTVTPSRVYYRLHGRQRWRYTYDDAELYELAGMLPAAGRSYVFFNNITMFPDALKFDKMLAERL